MFERRRRKTLLWLMGVVGAAVLASAGASVCAARALDVHRTERLVVDGAQLFVDIRGHDRRAPVLIWLHGGPGGPERPLFRYFNHDLERHFVVVYWDQRGTARSYDGHADPKALTVDRHVQDLDALVRHVTRTLGPQPVWLVGHSWGGTLALVYAAQHPERLAGVVAVAPDVAPAESQRRRFDFVSAEAARRRDRKTLDTLARIGPPPHQTADATLAVERIADRYGAVFHRRPHQMWILLNGMRRGLAWPWELPRYLHANHASLDAMGPELLTLDLRTTITQVEVPVVFMLGRWRSCGAHQAATRPATTVTTAPISNRAISMETVKSNVSTRAT